MKDASCAEAAAAAAMGGVELRGGLKQRGVRVMGRYGLDALFDVHSRSNWPRCRRNASAGSGPDTSVKITDQPALLGGGEG